MANFQEKTPIGNSLDVKASTLSMQALYPVAVQVVDVFGGDIFPIKNSETLQQIGYLVRDERQPSEEESLRCSLFPGEFTHFDRRAGILSRFKFENVIAPHGTRKTFGLNSLDWQGITTRVEFDSQGVSAVEDSRLTKPKEGITLFSYDAKVAHATLTGKDGRFNIPHVSWVARDKNQWVVRADSEQAKALTIVDRAGIATFFLARYDGQALLSMFSYNRDEKRAVYSEADGGSFPIDNVVSLTTGKSNEIKVSASKDGRVTELALDEQRIIHIKGSHIEPGKQGYAFEYLPGGLKGWYRVGKNKPVKMEKVIRVVRETDGWVLLYKEGEFEHEAKITPFGLAAFSAKRFDAEDDREFFSEDEGSYLASPHIADIWQTGGAIDIFLSEFTKNIRAKGVKIK